MTAKNLNIEYGLNEVREESETSENASSSNSEEENLSPYFNRD